MIREVVGTSFGNTAKIRKQEEERKQRKTRKVKETEEYLQTNTNTYARSLMGNNGKPIATPGNRENMGDRRQHRGGEHKKRFIQALWRVADKLMMQVNKNRKKKQGIKQ